MRKLLSLLGLLGSLSLWAQNVVFNPGFDMTPWDTGWTIETDTCTWNSGNCTGAAVVEVKADTGRSPPNCCHLYGATALYCSGGCGSGGGSAETVISQTFNEIVGCEVKVYGKYFLRQNMSYPPEPECNIQVRINNGWQTVWAKTCNAIYVVDTVWSEVCTTIVNDAVSGIRFRAFSHFYNPCLCSSDWAKADFWIDDVYVGKTGVEEGKLRVESLA